MTTIPRLLLASLPLLCGLVHAAESAERAAYLGKADCRIAPLSPSPVGDAVSWSGACKDGYADGKGVLEWRVLKEAKRKLEGSLVRGEVTGEGTLTYRDGSYVGTFRQGLPHGAGFFKHTNGDGMYEGGVVNGVREGVGEHIAPDRSTYAGEWKAGKRHGHGQAVFALGGSYEGQWANDRFHGQGKITYAGSGRVASGEFRAGYLAGTMPSQAGLSEERFSIRDARPIGSMLSMERVIGTVPPDASWEALTEAQKNVVREDYLGLAPGDEPPYPLKGTRAMHTAIANVYKKFTDYEGELTLHALIGKDGVPKNATMIGSPHPELTRYVGMIAMMQRFKPGICDGTPCELIYPVRFRFRTE